jgi:putative OPT family oligopeptide transporter
MTEKPFVPYVGPQETIPEFTARAIVLGLVLSVIMAAASVYLGLYAGMTVSASIPAAVISMGILRGVLKKGTILENNIVQTIASSGESLAAGSIFTIPALVITGVWTEFRLVPSMLIALFGGVLGILFMIPLRRALIVEEKELIYPEGTACAEILKVGEQGGSGALAIFGMVVLGAAFKFFVSGISLFKETVEGAWRAGKSAFYFGGDISVALMAVGVIVGFNVSLLVFLGGCISWFVVIPLHGVSAGFPMDGDILGHVMAFWKSGARFVGIGCMIVGGLWSIFKVRGSIVRSVQGAVAGYRAIDGGQATTLRTERDIPMKQIGAMLLVLVPGVFALYVYLTGSVAVAAAAGTAMVVTAFFFVAVSSYIVGLVGSSNNPVSGMTICTVLFTSGLLLLLGMSGKSGTLATLGVAGVVCCAACTGGAISQDLKTGYLIGATPSKQQWAQIIGVLPAPIIPLVMTVLHTSYGIGDQGKLRAPQATLFAKLSDALFNGKPLPWDMLVYGMLLGVLLIISDEILRKRGSAFRTYVMPVAVGLYLPFSLSTPMLLGGLVALVLARAAKKDGPAAVQEAEHKGTILCSGLIAGEALMGISLGGVLFFMKEILKSQTELPVRVLSSGPLSVAALLAVCALIFALTMRKKA